MVLSNYGVFSTGFTEKTCQQRFLLAPAFKGSFALPVDVYPRTLFTML